MKPVSQGRWKLWHFAVVVLLAAPLLATIRAISRGPNEPAELLLVALVVASACGGTSLAFFRLARKLAGGATSRLKAWGIRRDGSVGLLVYLVGLGLEVIYGLAAVLLGPVVTIALFAWLAGLISR